MSCVAKASVKLACELQKAAQKERDLHDYLCEKQWVLSFSHQARYWLSRDTDLFTDVMSAVTGVIANFYEQHTLSYDERGKVDAPSAGAVAFVQLFGSSLVLNPHLHLMPQSKGNCAINPASLAVLFSRSPRILTLSSFARILGRPSSVV